MVVPKKIEEICEAEVGCSFDRIMFGLMQRGFDGPRTWRHGYSIPFSIDVCEYLTVFFIVAFMASLSISGVMAEGDVSSFFGIFLGIFFPWILIAIISNIDFGKLFSAAMDKVHIGGVR
ncbi:hypothetical protein ACFOLJ_06415 [Rugamonas sp. CCM 8940]|uniref:hypothetical protein n=1 Tax=Rugamonas sp. CCM 8940 TaxID=2765359 RepID=UPI0018F50291|nr:hypothetical protein [Rugamonas sp. CCM 8940]MBJ7310412.1 hypothetical protein [Rugamonas sp. CCM 8940]